MKLYVRLDRFNREVPEEPNANGVDVFEPCSLGAVDGRNQRVDSAQRVIGQ